MFTDNPTTTPPPGTLAVTNNGTALTIELVDIADTNTLRIQVAENMTDTVTVTVEEPENLAFDSGEVFSNEGPYTLPIPLNTITNVTRNDATSFTVTLSASVNNVSGSNGVRVTRNGVNDHVNNVTPSANTLFVEVTTSLVGTTNVLTILQPSGIIFDNHGDLAKNATHTIPG